MHKAAKQPMANSPDSARVFIAAAPGKELAGLLGNAQRLISRHAVKASLTRLGNLHMTLRFIGDTSTDCLALLRRWFTGLPAPDQTMMTARLVRFGSFSQRDGLLLWAGLDVDAGLTAWVNNMETRLRALGFPGETRAFLPHITLARRATLSQSMADWLPPPEHTMVSFDSLTLYRSDFTPGGVVYTALDTLAISGRVSTP